MARNGDQADQNGVALAGGLNLGKLVIGDLINPIGEYDGGTRTFDKGSTDARLEPMFDGAPCSYWRLQVWRPASSPRRYAQRLGVARCAPNPVSPCAEPLGVGWLPRSPPLG